MSESLTWSRVVKITRPEPIHLESQYAAQFKESLIRSGYLAIVGQKNSPMPWDGDQFNKIPPTYSTNQDFVPYNLVEELESRTLFHI